MPVLPVWPSNKVMETLQGVLKQAPREIDSTHMCSSIFSNISRISIYQMQIHSKVLNSFCI